MSPELKKERYKVVYEKSNGETTEEKFTSQNTAKRFKIELEIRHSNVKLFEQSTVTGEWGKIT